MISESDLVAQNEWKVMANQVLAIVLNVLIFFSAPNSFCLVKNEYLFYLYALISVVASYKYLTHTKKYQLYNFEDLYVQLGGHLDAELKQQQPSRYYKKILRSF